MNLIPKYCVVPLDIDSYIMLTDDRKDKSFYYISKRLTYLHYSTLMSHNEEYDVIFDSVFSEKVLYGI